LSRPRQKVAPYQSRFVSVITRPHWRTFVTRSAGRSNHGQIYRTNNHHRLTDRRKSIDQSSQTGVRCQPGGCSKGGRRTCRRRARCGQRQGWYYVGRSQADIERPRYIL